MLFLLRLAHSFDFVGLLHGMFDFLVRPRLYG